MTWGELFRAIPSFMGSMAAHGFLLLLSLQIVFQVAYRTSSQPILVTLKPAVPARPALRIDGGPTGEAKGLDPLLEKGNNRLVDEDPQEFPELPPAERMKPGEKPSASPSESPSPSLPPFRPEKIAVRSPDAPAVGTSDPSTAGTGGGEKPLGLKIGESVGGAVRGNLQRNRPGDDGLLDGLKPDEVVVTTGVYDTAQRVLDSLRLPYLLKSPRQFDLVDLSKAKVVMVNCPGYLGQRGVEKLRAWVEKGGHLFTTDWSILLVERAFYGFIRSIGKTNQDWVAVAPADGVRDHPLLQDVFTRLEGVPQWWIESGSFPVKVLQPEKVQVLVTSEDMRLRYGHGTIALTFAFHQGRILHVCSHFDQAAGDAKAHFSMSQLIVNFILVAKKADVPGGGK